MNGFEGEWSESELYCTICNEVVAQRTESNSVIMMRCHCIEKAGHHEVEPSHGWLHKNCRGDEHAMRMEMMHAEMNAYSD